MLNVGLTGNIASGKSTVSRLILSFAPGALVFVVTMIAGLTLGSRTLSGSGRTVPAPAPAE